MDEKRNVSIDDVGAGIRILLWMNRVAKNCLQHLIQDTVGQIINKIDYSFKEISNVKREA